MLTPLDYYYEQCKQGFIFEDPQQLIAIESFQRVFKELIAEHKNRARLFSFLRKPKLIKGVYLWGGVGVGTISEP